MGGWSSSNANGDKSEFGRGGDDFWIVKIDSERNKIWDKRFGGNDIEYLMSLKQTKDGGYIMGGWSSSNANGDKTQNNFSGGFYFDYWVVKTDSVGNKQWDNTYGGLQDDGLFTIDLTFDGCYILGGYSRSDSSGNKSQANWDTAFYLNGSDDHWLVKIDSIGNIQWDKRYGTEEDELLNFALQTPDSGYIIVGGANTGISGDKLIEGSGIWIYKLDKNGTMLWQKIYSGGSSNGSFERTSDEGYLFSGSADKFDSFLHLPLHRAEDCLGKSNTWVMRLNADGDKLWDKVIFTTGKDLYSHANQTSDGCYVICNSSEAGIGGYKTEAAWDSSYDYFVLKFCMTPYNSITPLENGANFAMSVYPNPVVSDVSISINKEGLKQASFTLSNTEGQILFKADETNLASNYTKVLDLRWLPSGVYFIAVVVDGDQVVKEIVKE